MKDDFHIWQISTGISCSETCEMWMHYSHIIMGAMASHIISLTSVYSNFYSGADQRKHQSSAWLAFVREIHRWPVNSPDKWPITQKMIPFDDFINMFCRLSQHWVSLIFFFNIMPIYLHLNISHLNSTFIFDRYLLNWAVVTPHKYESNWHDQTYYFTNWNFL